MTEADGMSEAYFQLLRVRETFMLLRDAPDCRQVSNRKSCCDPL